MKFLKFNNWLWYEPTPPTLKLQSRGSNYQSFCVDERPAMSPLCTAQMSITLQKLRMKGWPATPFNILSSMRTVLVPLALKVTPEQTLPVEVTKGYYLPSALHASW